MLFEWKQTRLTRRPIPHILATNSLVSENIPWRKIRGVLIRSPAKTCSLDPIPTNVLLESIDILVPFICLMCNSSLSEGCFPGSQKAAIITPDLKKSNMDQDDAKNYRPISNVTFISKVIERIVAEQIKKHLVDSNSMPPLQSAYRAGHSTETALIKVIYDIIDAADGPQVTLLGLLDMSAAFDTVDHDILLHRLETSYGIRGRALRWLTFFLTGRTQAVSYAGRTSPQCRLSCGVPQGSVLGPLLFVLYTADVIGIVLGRGVRIHVYVDDTQIYVSCAASDRQPAATRLLACVSDIESWMSSNRLKLNASKTEFIWIGTRQQLSKVEDEALMVCGQSVTPMVKVRDLGVFIDRELTMEAHVSNTVRGCMYQLRQLRSVKRSLTLDSRRALATAFVASRIDYCNGVLYGVAKGEVQRLQMILNAAARLVVGTGKFSHVTPILRDVLHWFPVQHRISYKIAILARDCIHGIGPAYFGDVCAPVTAAPGRTNLRSATRGDLLIPRTRTKLGERSFRISAPTVWNSLPYSLKHSATSREHFRKRTETYLFRKAYAPASENY